MELFAYFKFVQNQIDQLVGIQVGAEDNGNFKIRLDQRQQLFDQRCFARADLTGQQNKTIAFPDAVLKIGQSVLMLGAEIQVFGIGYDLKRLLGQAIKLLVHGVTCSTV